MESGKRKLSGEVEPSKEKKKIKISIPTDQGLNSTCSMEEAKEKTCEKKQQQQHNIQFMKTFKTRENDIHNKARNPTPISKTGPAQQIAIDEACDPCSNSQKQLNSEKLLMENESCLRARVEELRNETYWLCYELEGLSKMCMATRESNTNLLENLKMICGPQVIHAIEEKNPDPDPQTDDDQRTGTPN